LHKTSSSCFDQTSNGELLHNNPNLHTGTLVAKTLVTSVSGQYAMQNAANQLVSLDVFALQVS
jgi:hypothetical protein